jgi:hypothetical protein
MSPILLSLIAFACIFGGTFLGMFLRRRLPGHHLSGDTKDVVRLGTGLIGTMAALVLGLLIASANSTYETQSGQVKQLTAYIVLLDNTLAQYGPETNSVRNLLRHAVTTLADRIWRENGADSGRKIQELPGRQGPVAVDDLLGLEPPAKCRPSRQSGMFFSVGAARRAPRCSTAIGNVKPGPPTETRRNCPIERTVPKDNIRSGKSPRNLQKAQPDLSPGLLHF